MKNIGNKLLLLVTCLVLIQACGPSEAEKRAAEQARMDSLRAVQQQQIADQMAAMQDSLDRAEAKLVAEPKKDVRTGYNFVDNGPYAVQVGAFRSESRAESFLNKWKNRDFPNTYIVKVGNEAVGDVWFRVRVGFFGNKADAEALGAQLAKEINSGYWVSKVR